MLIGGIAVAALVVVLAGVVVTRRRARDDVHSVEGYHRQLHTLEEINTHPGSDQEGEKGERPSFPESAIRLSSMSTVRVMDGPAAVVPPVPPPPVADPEKPVTFDDAGPVTVPSPQSVGAVVQTNDRRQDRAMNLMNRRPRRLGAPALAVLAVVVLIVVLLITGSHTPKNTHHGKGTTGHGSTVTVHRSKSKGASGSKAQHHTHAPTTTTTTLPIVSDPQSVSANGATYDVSKTSYALSLLATSGPCWVDVTNQTTGATLFSGLLSSGQLKVVDATSPVTVVVGAPEVLGVAVDGMAVKIPAGYQTPYTMQFTTTATTPSTS